MTNMDLKTHRILTALLYITFSVGLMVLIVMGDEERWLTISLYLVIIGLATFSHYRYYSNVEVMSQGKIFLVIEMLLTYAVIYTDRSTYEQIFLLILVGDCIFAYDYSYSFKYVLGSYGMYYFLGIVIFPLVIGRDYPFDFIEDMVIALPVVAVLYITRYQINGKMRYDRLLEERNDAYEQLRLSAEKIEAYAVNEERARIALMLHNSLGHLLVATSMSLQAEKMERVSQGQIDHDAFEEVEKSIQKAMNLLRKTVEGDVDLLGTMTLSEVMDMLVSDVANNVGIRVEYHPGEIDRIPENLKAVVYNSVLESVTNALKHSGGSCICISFDSSETEVSIEIRDNGKGNEDFTGGYGTARLKKDIEALGGTYSILSDEGCTVTVSLPYRRGRNES